VNIRTSLNGLHARCKWADRIRRCEAAAAAAGGLGVGIADHELGTGQALGVIHLGPHQVLQAERIDQQGDAFGHHRQIVVGPILVELETVLKPGTATALMYTRKASASLPSSWISSRTLAAAAGVNTSGAFQRLVARGGRGGRQETIVLMAS
jgi:hypothetical protein